MAITACTLTHLGPLPAEPPNGTSSGIPIGTAFADRLVVILIAGDFTGASLSGAVGGTNLSSDGIASVISAFIPSGTTTTLTVTGGTTLPGAPVLDFPICAVYAIAGATSNVPTDVGSALGSASGGTTPMTANIDVLSDGAIIAAAGDGGGAGTAFTAGVDSDGTATPSISVRAGSREYASGGTYAVTNAGNYALLVASYAGSGGGPTDPPSNTSVPTLSPTKAYIGQAIGGGPGIWTNSPTSYAYRWRLDGTIVSGATSATYTPVSGDEGKKPQKGVIATNAIGSSSEAWSAEGDPITLAPVTTTVNTTGAGSLTLTSTELPNGTGVLNLVEGWGPGAGGARRGRGSGGGAFAASNNAGDGWTVSVGDTIYWNVGAGAAGTSDTTGGTPSSDTWIRITTNSAPTLVSHGALAKAGSAGTSTVNGAGGTTAASIGTTKFAGGAGGNTGSGTTLRGAGGGGAGSAGAGGNASAATQGAAGSPDGGLGGASSTGTSVAAAAAPGGGGGAISGASGNGGTGGNGRVRFTITADGPSGSPTIVGALSATDSGSDTTSAPGMVALAGSLAVSEGTSDTAAGLGAVTISGSLDVGESEADSVVASGSTILPTISGDIVVIESAGDTASATGSVAIGGSAVLVDGSSDTTAAIGGTTVAGGISVIDNASELAAVSGSTGCSGALAAAEQAPDSLALIGGLPIAGGLLAQDIGGDSTFIIGGRIAIGDVQLTDVGSDSVAASGSIAIAGLVDAQASDADAAAVFGSASIACSLGSVGSSPDQLGIVGSLVAAGSAIIVDRGVDVAALDGALTIAGALTSVEAADELHAFGNISLAGVLGALESGADLVQAIGALAANLEDIPISELLGWIDALTRLEGRIDASTMLAAQVDIETQLKGTIG